MHKSGYLVVKPVGKLFGYGGLFEGLYSAVKSTFFIGVHKTVGLYRFIPGVLQGFIHRIFLSFLSVNDVFIPTIHTTYNKLQLININNFVFNSRRLK